MLASFEDAMFKMFAMDGFFDIISRLLPPDFRDQNVVEFPGLEKMVNPHPAP
jgi:hypothetical protein